jgi:quercetin dioxygenase-like cupin family protein
MRLRLLIGFTFVFTVSVWFGSASQRTMGRIVPEGGGDQVVRRWGLAAAALINPDNAGSKDFVVITEAVPGGGAIPVHRHPHAEEIILVQQGSGTAVLGDARHPVKAGATVFVPQGEWHGLENHGSSQLDLMAIFSRPGYHTYFSATSVTAGQPVHPLSPDELKQVRERFKDVIEFKEP